MRMSKRVAAVVVPAVMVGCVVAGYVAVASLRGCSGPAQPAAIDVPESEAAPDREGGADGAAEALESPKVGGEGVSSSLNHVLNTEAWEGSVTQAQLDEFDADVREALRSAGYEADTMVMAYSPAADSSPSDGTTVLWASDTPETVFLRVTVDPGRAEGDQVRVEVADGHPELKEMSDGLSG